MQQSKDIRKFFISNKKRFCYLIVGLLIIAILAIGLTRAWFFNKMDTATMMAIKGPGDITILGPHGSDMAALDLSYTDADKDTNNKVTIRRVICIKSEASKFKMEIVHTTNLKGLEFKLYPATEVNEADSTTVVDGGYNYSYQSDGQVSGSYINQNPSTNEYKYATNQKHSVNYESYASVQSHAEPLYWLTGELNADNNNNETSSVNNEIKTYHKTYYVCEISWTETTKETDIFYILAKTA